MVDVGSGVTEEALLRKEKLEVEKVHMDEPKTVAKMGVGGR